jgi:hypothetical protein
LSVRRPSKKSSRSPLRLRPPNRNFDWISSALPWLPTEAPHARHLPWTNEWTKRSFRAPSTMFGEWRTNEQAMTRQKHDRHVAGSASRMDNESSKRCEPGLLCTTRVRATQWRDGLLPVPQAGIVIISVAAKSCIRDAGRRRRPGSPSPPARRLVASPCVLLPPFWSWSTHIMQFRPVRIMQRARQPPPAPANRINARGRRTFREQHCTDIGSCNRAHG